MVCQHTNPYAVAEVEPAFGVNGRWGNLEPGRSRIRSRRVARVGTTPSVISRLDDDDYDGHSLAMLRRIAAALNKRVEIRFVPLRGKRAP